MHRGRGRRARSGLRDHVGRAGANRAWPDLARQRHAHRLMRARERCAPHGGGRGADGRRGGGGPWTGRGGQRRRSGSAAGGRVACVGGATAPCLAAAAGLDQVPCAGRRAHAGQRECDRGGGVSARAVACASTDALTRGEPPDAWVRPRGHGPVPRRLHRRRATTEVQPNAREEASGGASVRVIPCRDAPRVVLRIDRLDKRGEHETV